MLQLVHCIPIVVVYVPLLGMDHNNNKIYNDLNINRIESNQIAIIIVYIPSTRKRLQYSSC
jgi:hypothetical protein